MWIWACVHTCFYSLPQTRQLCEGNCFRKLNAQLYKEHSWKISFQKARGKKKTTPLNKSRQTLPAQSHFQAVSTYHFARYNQIKAKKQIANLSVLAITVKMQQRWDQVPFESVWKFGSELVFNHLRAFLASELAVLVTQSELSVVQRLPTSSYLSICNAARTLHDPSVPLASITGADGEQQSELCQTRLDSRNQWATKDAALSTLLCRPLNSTLYVHAEVCTDTLTRHILTKRQWGKP